MSFDINVLVNGNRCKQYFHNGKIYIEAKNGSEYSIEIKNNYWKRVLSVMSVDGLNVLTGKTAAPTDSGYIVPAYSTERIKGFRFSDTEWAMFKFGYKFNGNTYAQSKNDGSEANCGVIGTRIHYEVEPVVQWTPAPNVTVHWGQPPWVPQPPTPQWTTTTTTTTCGGPTSSYSMGSAGMGNVNYTCGNLASQNPPGSTMKGGPISPGPSPIKFQQLAGIKKGSSNKGGEKISAKPRARSSAGGCSAGGETLSFMDAEYERGPMRSLCGSPEPDYDMGTEWGRREVSRVHNVTFDRGCLAHTIDIYYASRESLIAMGIPLHNPLLVQSQPQSFPTDYAQPPSGWSGH